MKPFLVFGSIVAIFAGLLAYEHRQAQKQQEEINATFAKFVDGYVHEAVQARITTMVNEAYNRQTKALIEELKKPEKGE